MRVERDKVSEEIHQPEIGCDLLPRSGKWEWLDISLELSLVQRKSLAGKCEAEQMESTAEEVTLGYVDAQIVRGQKVYCFYDLFQMLFCAGTAARNIIRKGLGVGGICEDIVHDTLKDLGRGRETEWCADE